jgi:hypothetical protein
VRLCKKKITIKLDLLLDKMKVKIKWLCNMSVFIALTVVMFWGYISSLQSLWELKQGGQYVLLSYEKMAIGFSRESAVKALEQNGESDVPMRFVFWKQKGSGTVAAVGLNNSVETEVIAVCGRTDILYMDTAVLDVKSLRGCLISSSLAFQLFGNANVVGLSVMIEDITYEIIGVVDSKTSFFVYEPDANDTVLFNRVTIYGEDVNRAEILSVKFKGQYLGWKSVNYRLMVSVLSIVVLILPVGIGIYLLWLLKNYHNESVICIENTRARRYQSILWCLKSMFVLILLALIIRVVVELPINMIPDRWSNFEFWSKWWDGIKESGIRLFYMEKSIPDQKYISTFMHGLGYQLIAICSGNFIFSYVPRLVH